MPTRREASDVRRAAKHRSLVDAATTSTGRLWRACLWLIAEAKHRHKLAEATTIVLHLIEQIRAGEPLTGATPEPAPAETGGAPTPWYVQVRAADGDRRDNVA